jgi:hypothetical protein
MLAGRCRQEDGHSFSPARWDGNRQLAAMLPVPWRGSQNPPP